jgi:hypothetical protein
VLDGADGLAGAPERGRLIAKLIGQPRGRVRDKRLNAVLRQQVRGPGQEHNGEDDDRESLLDHRGAVTNKNIVVWSGRESHAVF